MFRTDMKRLLLVMLGLLCLSGSVGLFALASGHFEREVQEFAKRNKDAHMFPEKQITPISNTISLGAGVVGVIGLILIGLGIFGGHERPTVEAEEKAKRAEGREPIGRA